MNPYEKLMARKRKWTPVAVTAGKCKAGARRRSTVLLHCDIWNYLWEILSMMLWPLKFRLSPESYSSLMYGMKRTTTWLLISSPMLTALIKRLRKKHYGYEKRGLRIQITRYSKQWLPSVQFFCSTPVLSI